MRREKIYITQPTETSIEKGPQEITLDAIRLSFDLTEEEMQLVLRSGGDAILMYHTDAEAPLTVDTFQLRPGLFFHPTALTDPTMIALVKNIKQRKERVDVLKESFLSKTDKMRSILNTILEDSAPARREFRRQARLIIHELDSLDALFKKATIFDGIFTNVQIQEKIENLMNNSEDLSIEFFASADK